MKAKPGDAGSYLAQPWQGRPLSPQATVGSIVQNRVLLGPV